MKNLFITGCDWKTEWQLPWFLENFKKHNPSEDIVVFNFGSKPLQNYSDPIQMNDENTGGWFKKPSAMLKASTRAKNVCWLDTDCEVLQPLSKIFRLTEKNKLAMAEDRPWSKRRGEKWHNSGVVAFQGRPLILSQWSEKCMGMREPPNPLYGDQDILHHMLKDPIKRMASITDLPPEYNTLRLDYIDNIAPKDPRVIHHTGKMGKEKIRELMRGAR